MALSMVVGIPDLAHTYMEPMETASSNLHASGLTYSPQGVPFLYSQTLSRQDPQSVSSAKSDDRGGRRGLNKRTWL